jgi:hypothetical protein
MGIRVGVSRRARRGRVWVSMPLGVLVLAVLVAGPYVLYWYAIKGLVLLVAWLARQVRQYLAERAR